MKIQKLIVFGLLILTIIALSGCNQSEELENSWVGYSKKNLTATVGQPTEIQPNPRGGEIYIYEKNVMYQAPDNYGSQIYNQPQSQTTGQFKSTLRSSVTRFWIDEDGKIYKVEAE